VTESNDPLRLSQVPTMWTVLSQARGDGPTTLVKTAQRQLLERYGKIVHRYLLGALRDADAADELFQEFSLRFIRGDLRGADRSRGRFRDFLKGVLYHLIGDFHRRQKKRFQPLPESDLPANGDPQQNESDERFLENWRSELLNRAWKGLQQLEEQTGQPYHTLLHFRAENPEVRSEQMAEQLGPQLGKLLTAAGVRQTLHRAREKFSETLVDEVAQSLVEPTIDDLEQELIDIGLRDYCASAIQRLREST
jgi:RNA polymerase sigma factor (sigma-70 family)